MQYEKVKEELINKEVWDKGLQVKLPGWKWYLVLQIIEACNPDEVDDHKVNDPMIIELAHQIRDSFLSSKPVDLTTKEQQDYINQTQIMQEFNKINEILGN